MPNSTSRVCAYCGRRDDDDLTLDHVPPKLLLERPYPHNLITVPACIKCNKGFQRDDEYTRDVVALDLRAGASVAASSKVPKIFRSLQRPESRRYASYLRDQIAPTQLLDATGRPIAFRVTPDRDRIDATGRHIALGMHFHFAGEPLPAGYQIHVYSKPGYDSIDFITENLNGLFNKATARRDGFIGNGFSYAAASFGDAFVYLFLLYEYFWWVVSVSPAHARIPGLMNDEA